jgi:phosphoserine phosphatase RsbU/P
MSRNRFALDQALKDRALDIANEGFTIADLRLPQGPLIYVNEGFERLTGYSAEEVVGTNCRLLQGPETDPQARDEIRRAIAERRECRVEILNYRKDGTPFWNRLSLTPVVGAGGEVTHYIGVQTDVSARRLAEEQLRKANEELRLASMRMRSSLEAAARIQQSLLPDAAPDIPGLRFAWGFRPSAELAGDLLGIVPLSSRYVGLYVIDVSGHGVPAALLSVTLSHWLAPARGQSPLVVPDVSHADDCVVASPARVAERLSQQFPFDTRTAQYFTMVYGVVDAERHALRFVCAGHPAPIHQPRGGAPRVLEASGFPVGIFPQATYEEREIVLGPGDRVFLYSDGIVEAENPEGREFGRHAMLEALEDSGAQPLQSAIASVLAASERHAGDSDRKDDVTLLGLEIV